ncbi:MAG: signal peptidase I [Alphaproteobacteria bacterium]|jgi:signal peptidase I|nr:signal peptidase I [Alphaproteobacteria bacterium]MDP6563495.1 signal peptidase I [Alphaproteobacteria bacterium]MDP6812681.1 signal peptidase I [Alphaproteobacteria bacterium]
MDLDSTESTVPKRGESLRETIKTVVYAVLIALVIRTVAYEPFNIPSGSMLPTLLIGDYVFVAKFPYGYSRHSLPLSPPVFDGRIVEDPVERGDIAVFKLPKDNATDYIKRIIGLPGDRIQVIDGVLHINDAPVKREQVEDFVQPEVRGMYHRVRQYRETLPDGRSYLTLDLQPRSMADNTNVYVVPAGHYFAMGDNRDDSTDSRFLAHVGFIPAENLVGRADVIFFSVNGDTRFWQVWKWPWAIRFRRLFDTLG